MVSVSDAFAIFLITISVLMVAGFVFLAAFIVWRTRQDNRYDYENYNVRLDLESTDTQGVSGSRYLNVNKLEFEDDGTITVVVTDK